MRALAARFRRKAKETQLADFVDMMLRTAVQLEEMAALMEQRADCDGVVCTFDLPQGSRPGNPHNTLTFDPAAGEHVVRSRLSAAAGKVP
jgi:hypothetical protein